jgi:hypothetical protein
MHHKQLLYTSQTINIYITHASQTINICITHLHHKIIDIYTISHMHHKLTYASQINMHHKLIINIYNYISSKYIKVSISQNIKLFISQHYHKV